MSDKKLFNRATYKRVRKMDRQEMESYVATVYQQGFRDGAEVGQEADVKIELHQFLGNLDIKGIGEKTKEKILKAYKERGNKDD